MKGKWIPLEEGEELAEIAVVTRRTKDNRYIVGVGRPGLGVHIGCIAYMPMPKSYLVDPRAWHSEYRGDDPPSKSDKYLVFLIQVQPIGDSDGYKIDELYYDANRLRWYAVPPNWEVYAWTTLPKPYMPKGVA